MRPTRQDFADFRAKQLRPLPAVEVQKEAAAARKRAEELMADPRTATAAKDISDMIQLAESQLASAINLLVEGVLSTDDVMQTRERAVRARNMIFGLTAALNAFMATRQDGALTATPSNEAGEN